MKQMSFRMGYVVTVKHKGYVWITTNIIYCSHEEPFCQPARWLC